MSSSSAPSRSCLDCGRAIRVTRRYIRCESCRIAASPIPLQTQPCTDCGALIYANDTYVRCDTCRLSTPLQQHSSLRAPERRTCWACGDAFFGGRRVTRCSRCRRRSSTVVQGATDSSLPGPSFNPYTNSFDAARFQPPAAVIPRKRKIPLPSPQLPLQPAKPINNEKLLSLLHQAVKILHQEFHSRLEASDTFPPEISPSHIRASIARYETMVAAATEDVACCLCGRLTPHEDIRQLHDEEPLLQPWRTCLDDCARQGTVWNSCSACYSSLLRHQIPKFSSRNQINVTFCQHYPAVLDGLTLTEEYLIAKSHPVGVVLKLRPGGRASPINHHALRGHFIVIPQDPDLLLQILPCPRLRFTQLIKVVWLGSTPPSTSDLEPFLIVRKLRVLAALRYLVEHNPLYRDVTIDYPAIDSWADDFIPTELQDHVISLTDTDHHERAGYAIDLEGPNYENDWQAAEDDLSDAAKDSLLLTASVSTDINGERQDPDLRTLNAVYHVKNSQPIDSDEAVLTPDPAQSVHRPPTSHPIPLLKYTIRGEARLLSHWQDPDYFLSAFPTLFPRGVGGHLDQRPVPVSIASFADWALRHHSRRFARHKTFMYLMYDVLQLRNSSLGNSLLVKRSQWSSVTRDINSVSSAQLQNAVKVLATTKSTDDPLIRRLLKNITSIGIHVPGSFYQKLQMRGEIRGLLVREGMPAFWLTVNPSDLQNPLVLTLAGVPLNDSMPSLTSDFRRNIATSDPVAVARFFHCTCRAILDGLIGTKPAHHGIFGDVSNYFGVVESNGRGMLHLHAMIWVRGNLRFIHLRDRIRTDGPFATRMIRYLESTIMHSLQAISPDTSQRSIPRRAPSATERETHEEFFRKLFHDSNAVASAKQIHSKRHSATCFKYNRRNSSCRFGMPRALIHSSKVDEHGIIHLARNHPWVNPWNPAIATCIRSNHDISWIPTVSKSLSLIYYITNYATKDDISPLQIVTKAALLRQAIESANNTPSPTRADLRLRQKGLDNFALRCFNSLSHDREVSGVQVASTLLGLPSYYTLHHNFIRINLWSLRQHIRSHTHLHRPSETSSAAVTEETVTYDHRDSTPTTIFDNYRWRGDLLSPLSFFEYCMLVRTKRLEDATLDDIPFEEKHPRHSTHMQRLARSPSQTLTVTLQGQLTEFQTVEDSIPGGHPTTTAIENDLAEILLGLFIPWEKLATFVLSDSPPTQNIRQDLHQIWTAIQPTLPPHCQTFAKNIELLRKSQSDCQADAFLRKQSAEHTSPLDHELAGPPYPVSDSDEETRQLAPTADEALDTETLLAAFFAISRRWALETLDAQRHLPTLASSSLPPESLQPLGVLPLDISHGSLHTASALKFMPPTTIQEWQTRLKDITALEDRDADCDPSTGAVPDVDDFNCDTMDGILVPLLTDSESLPDLQHYRSQLENEPTGPSLTALIHRTIPLNEKQRIVVQRILSGALAWAHHPYDPSYRQQTLLYIGGEGGVGKSQVIKGIVAGMDLINRKDEIILMAPTGAAADMIGGNTYHTSLGISLDRSRKKNMTARIRRLWSQKTIMIIDEVSMIDLSTLKTIEVHCSNARSLPSTSPDRFGGLPVVILMGDFHQFPPVRGQPLWKTPRDDGEQDGKHLWNQFKEVVILTEQMRQVNDLQYQNLLARARSGSLTTDDLQTLNAKTISTLASLDLQDTTVVTRTNTLRTVINRIQIERFARARRQKVYIFPAIHTRTRNSGPTNLRLRADDLLGLPEQGTKVPSPGLLLFTVSMPAMILTNISTRAGLVNGASGTAVGIVVDPSADFHELDDLFVFCTKPPACLLFKPNRPKSFSFPALDQDILPVFPLETSITIKGYSVRRRQIPICSAFCLTDYKVQGATLSSATLDLKNSREHRSRDSHRRYCSVYVQLSRLRSLEGLHLLQALDMEDLQHKPDPQLLDETKRLHALECETLHGWEAALP